MMKLSFSTNGWTDFSWTDYCLTAKEYRFQGIEIYDIHREMFSGKNGPLTNAMLSDTNRRLIDMGIEIPCIDCACNFADPDHMDENCRDVERHIEVASALGAPYVRVRADQTSDRDDLTVIMNLKQVLPFAEEMGITVLIETVGAYADTAKLRDVLNVFASDHLGALWDMHHPYRMHGESAEATVQNLGAYIRHVHLKDSVAEENGFRYCLMGEGDLPLESMIRGLRSINYEGYLSFEWIPSWLADMNDVSILFPHFISVMQRFDADAQRAPKLFTNRTNTGYHIWEKDALIDLTFSQVLDKVVETFPDQYAFRFTTLDYTRTYSQFRDDVDEFARALISLGVRKGDHVALWATNLPQWYIAFWSTVKIGAVLVTVNTAYKIHEAEYLLRQSDTHTLIMVDGYRDSDYVAIMKELCPELRGHVAGQPLHCKRLPFLRNIITIESEQEGCLTWKGALAMAENTPKAEVLRRAAEVSKHDVCNMQYTSGTTGFPKGVMLTHYNIVNNGKCIGDRMDLSTVDRMMIQVPMFHCFGMVLAMTASMTHSVTMCPLPYFSPRPALACINQEKITCFHGVPTMFIAMLEHDDFAKTDFSHMRTGIMAGSPCPISVMQDVVNKMHMTEITIVYGQTEAAPGCTMSSTDDPIEVRVGTVGRPMPGIECRVVDPETGEDVPDGVNGEFVARGYNIMKGYYKMPRATEAAIDADGWLHTGDLAARTPEGNFRITGRLKDMIIRGGENIYPKEIEEFIYTHPKVRDVQVIGVPDESYGEEIMACIILKDGETMTEAEMKQYVRDHMARHKVPRYVDFVTEFPMNAAGKIQKYKMREQAVEKLGLKKAASIVTA